ncbi:MAG: hypothetical protein BWK79_16300 [Beggiatoa sp. IS2]|nr:MAG: hypothetical protein BWK79_16300 [Beggiatoa sp. IS2]
MSFLNRYTFGLIWFILNYQAFAENSFPISVTEVPEPASWQAQIDYYRSDETGDVWGTTPAWQLPTPSGELPQDVWKYGLRAIYLAKYACQSAEVRDWMPTNIANGVYYCTNPEDKQQTIDYLRTLADRLWKESNVRTSGLRAGDQMPALDSEPTAEQTPIDYYRDEMTGDVWGTEPAHRFLTPPNLPEDLYRYGLRALYLAKYACQSADVRDWMPTNIANGIYYCTNPEDREQTISYLLALADKLESDTSSSPPSSLNPGVVLGGVVLAEHCVDCGQVMVGAALVQPNTIQWIGNTSPASFSISSQNPSFGFTGEHRYQLEKASSSAQWVMESINNFIIGNPPPNGAAPKIGFFFAPSIVGNTQSTIFYDTHTQTVNGIGIADNESNPSLTIEVLLEGATEQSACAEGTPACQEVSVSTGSRVTFKVTPHVQTQNVPAGVQADHLVVRLDASEKNTFCQKNGIVSFIEKGTANDFSSLANYYHYLNGLGPNEMPGSCSRSYSFLVAKERSFDFYASNQSSTDSGYVEYSFYISQHKNDRALDKWSGSHQTFRLRSF